MRVSEYGWEIVVIGFFGEICSKKALYLENIGKDVTMEFSRYIITHHGTSVISLTDGDVLIYTGTVRKDGARHIRKKYIGKNRHLLVRDVLPRILKQYFDVEIEHRKPVRATN